MITLKQIFICQYENACYTIYPKQVGIHKRNTLREAISQSGEENLKGFKYSK
jgi:hypothetical protein